MEQTQNRKPKYSIGDEVYIIHSDHITKRIVTGIISMGETFCYSFEVYDRGDNIHSFQFRPEDVEVFSSKEEIIERIS